MLFPKAELKSFRAWVPKPIYLCLEKGLSDKSIHPSPSTSMEVAIGMDVAIAIFNGLSARGTKSGAAYQFRQPNPASVVDVYDSTTLVGIHRQKLRGKRDAVLTGTIFPDRR